MPTKAFARMRPGRVVGLAGLEHLAVRGLVRQEGELGEDDAEGTGHEQLVPGVAEQDEAGDGAAEGGEQDAEDHPVEARATTQQSEVAHGVQQSRVLGGRIGPVSAGLGADDPDSGGGCGDGF